VVEDNDNYRVAISSILEASPGCSCVGNFGNAEDFLERLDEFEPEVVLMDLGLPGMSGIDAIRLLKQSHPRIEVVVLSVYEDDDKVFDAICAGASGYITKPLMPQQLVDTVEQAFGGGTPMSPKIARRVLEMFKQHVPAPRSDYNLTPRELDVLTLLTKGEDCKRIADSLYVSQFTVRAHLRNIYEKLHVKSNTEAVAKALKERVVRGS
jgi:DNA-binding NarL/FixJ family response regulator